MDKEEIAAVKKEKELKIEVKGRKPTLMNGESSLSRRKTVAKKVAFPIFREEPVIVKPENEMVRNMDSIKKFSKKNLGLQAK